MKSPNSGRARAPTVADAHDFGTRSSGRKLCSRCFAFTVPALLVALASVLALAATLRVGHAMWRASPRRPGDCAVPWPTAEPAAVAAGRGGSGASASGGGHRLRIALVSMSTGRAKQQQQQQQQPRQADIVTAGGAADGASEGGVMSAAVNFRAAEFSDLLDLTGPVFAQYAQLHGYTYADASGLMDASRPASWSKILAVLSALDAYDWVMWVDADILITNTSLPLERLLPAAAAADPSRPPSGPDFILTVDAAGVNAGVWLMRGRGCAWCRAFLARWWSMASFIRTDVTSGKSGDNDALKHMIATMDPDELAAHVGFAPQCACNSYPWRSSARTWARWLARPYMMQGGLWQPGDFLLHLAGINAKKAYLQRFTREQQQRRDQQQQRAAVLQPHTQPLTLGGQEAATAVPARDGAPQDGRAQQLWNARRLQEGRRYLKAARGRRWVWGWGSRTR